MAASHSENCDPCKYAKKQQEASVYCDVCSEYMCGTCKVAHDSVDSNKDHEPRNLTKGSSKDCKMGHAGGNPGLKGADRNKSAKLSSDMMSMNLGSAPSSVHNSSAWSPIFSKAILQIQFNAASATDKVACGLKSTVILQNMILIADYDNSKIKAFDKDTREFVFDTQVESVYDMTKISENVIAATSGQHMYFTMFSFEDTGLSEIRKVLTEYECWGICYNSNHVYVVCGESENHIAEVHVYTMEGNFIERFDPMSQGRKVFRAPSYIAVNPHEEVLYIGDYYTGNVVALTLTGELVFDRSPKECNTVLGVATGKMGELYACGLNSNNVIMVSPDGITSRVLNSFDATRPQCVTVNENMMILCRQDTNYVNVFKLS